MSRFSDFLRRAKNTSCSVVVVAAGASTRMGEDKLFMDLAGKPVLARTLTALNACSCVDEIVVVTRLESLEKVAALCREYRVDKVGKVVVGGASRTESALAGSRTDPAQCKICTHSRWRSSACNGGDRVRCDAQRRAL